MLDQLDILLCSQNPTRKRSLILNWAVAEHLHFLRNRLQTRKFKKCLVREGVQFFDTERILIPVNFSLHYTLFVVFMQTRDIVYYDSLDYPYPSCLSNDDILDYIEDEAEEANIPSFHRSEWNFHRATVVNQVNSLDCGYCVIKHAMLDLQDLPLDLKVSYYSLFFATCTISSTNYWVIFIKMKHRLI